MVNYQNIIQDINQRAENSGRTPSDITLVAVSKNQPVNAVLDLYSQGCRDFGENRIQEATAKIEAAPRDIRWHMIGTLQTKKIPKVLGRFVLIHSVDTPHLAEEISKRASEKVAILLQVNTSGESSKHGLSPEEWTQEMAEVLKLPHLDIQGFMTMAPFTEDKETIRQCFARLRLFRDQMKKAHQRSFPHLSMGMSRDYPIAIEEGATILRIGTALFHDIG